VSSRASANLKTNVYVDGFNLFYGCLIDKPYRWLNVEEMARRVLPPGHVIGRTRYFTARVIALPTHPHQTVRQQFYLRALRTVPNLTVHLGTFLRSKTSGMLVTPLANGTDRLPIWKFEEKGSDVNIATYMLFDAFNKEYNVAALVSDDSDLVEPIKILRNELKVDVIVLSPRGQSSELRQVANQFRPINHSVLPQCQFPSVMQDASGQFHKPPGW
jgi:uncharacterized LabA/DUF88 family protein